MINKETIKHIAKLARLQLSPEEEQTYSEQLGKILGHVNELQSVDTKDIEPAAHVLPISNVMREDEVKPCTQQSAILENAPQKEGKFFRVPKIGE